MPAKSNERNVPQGIRDKLKRDEVLLWELSGNVIGSLRPRLRNRLDDMLKSQEASLANVNELDPDIRIAALGLLAHHWPPNRLLEERYLSVIVGDDSEMDVRAVGVSCLSGLYKGSSNRDVINLLSKIVRDETNSRNLRAVAYLGILKVLNDGSRRRAEVRIIAEPGLTAPQC